MFKERGGHSFTSGLLEASSDPASSPTCGSFPPVASVAGGVGLASLVPQPSSLPRAAPEAWSHANSLRTQRFSGFLFSLLLERKVWMFKQLWDK